MACPGSAAARRGSHHAVPQLLGHPRACIVVPPGDDAGGLVDGVDQVPNQLVLHALPVGSTKGDIDGAVRKGGLSSACSLLRVAARATLAAGNYKLPACRRLTPPASCPDATPEFCTVTKRESAPHTHSHPSTRQHRQPDPAMAPNDSQQRTDPPTPHIPTLTTPPTTHTTHPTHLWRLPQVAWRRQAAVAALVKPPLAVLACRGVGMGLERAG